MKKSATLIMVILLCHLSVLVYTQRVQVYGVEGIPKLAVTPAYYDRMQDVLDDLGYSYQTIQKNDLANLSALNKYDVVFINCAPVYTPIESTFAPIREFVSGGGAIYASDWAYEYVEGAFPTYVQFVGRTAPSQKVNGTITDEGVKTYLNISEFEIDYDLSAWVPISNVSSQVNVYVVNDVSYNGALHNNTPTVIGFKYGNGYVVYTSFHNSAQDITAYKLMEYLVLLTVTSEIRLTLESVMNQKNADVKAIYTDKLNKGATVTHSYNVAGKSRLVFAVNWFGSEMKLSVFRPNGIAYTSSSSQNPPLIVEISDAEPGVWTYTVQAVDVPVSNYPVVSMVGASQAEALGFDWLFLVVITVIIVAAVVTASAILYRRKRSAATITTPVQPPPPPPPPPANSSI